jgi:endo-1,4-beta-xylanase
MKPLLLLVRAFSLLAALFTLAASVRAQSPAPSVPASGVLPQNLSPGGPPIPTTPPVEPAHPPSLLLWPNGAPGSDAFKGHAEIVGYRQEPDIVFAVVYNIHDPSITPFLPSKETATGCAVIIAPGGGHMFLTIDREGYDLARWLADHGVAAFVLKYRLARDLGTPAGQPQPYTVAINAAADAQRAVRLVRSRAADWGVNPDHVGLIGFSAGGEVAADLITNDDAGNSTAPDPLDRLDSRPNFVAFAYPGMPASWRADTWTPPKDMPPTFLLCASGDRPNISEFLPAFYLTLKKASVPVELHIFNQGGHGFGVRPWSYSVAIWPVLFRGWLNDRGFLKNP